MEYQPPVQSDTLTLPSGRVLAWCIYGGPLYAAEGSAAPAVVFYCHGFPGSRVEPAYLRPALLQEHHARFLALDRPGMGESTHDPARRVLDWPADVLAVADHLGIESFYVLGVSGGGPYALACAHAIPRVGAPEGGRLRGVAVVAGMYPPGFGVAGMRLPTRMLLGAGAWLPRMATGYLLNWEMGSAAQNPDVTVLERLMDREMGRRQEIEHQVYKEPRVRETCINGLREAFRQGTEGAATELMLFSNDWGFELTDIKDQGKGVKIWHGRLDVNIPVGMAEKAKEAMPEAQLTIYDDEAHLSLPVNHVEEILAELLE